MLAAALVLAVLGGPVAAQSSPGDLTELSLAELMQVELVPSTEVAAHPFGERWTLRYRYVRREFDGYYDGTKKLSNEEVLWRPGEVRTNKNFPVLPTEIYQEAHVAELSYQASERWNLNLIVPYIRQSTEHISVVPGYSAFTITSDGLGDIAVTGGYSAWNGERASLSLSAGLSLPTGSIDEQGDTPRAPGDQLLPYTMQLGSGTWDLTGGFTYAGHTGSRAAESACDWGFLTLGKLRLGRNDHGYSLGDRLFASAWVGTEALGWLRPTLRLNAQAWGKIDGQDDELTVPGPFPYPAPVTNPDLFGGKKVSLLLGLEFRPTRPGGFLAQQTLRIEVGGPIYQDLNGPQPGEEYELSLVWSWSR